jgi:hypothetical protein
VHHASLYPVSFPISGMRSLACRGYDEDIWEIGKKCTRIFRFGIYKRLPRDDSAQSRPFALLSEVPRLLQSGRSQRVKALVKISVTQNPHVYSRNGTVQYVPPRSPSWLAMAPAISERSGKVPRLVPWHLLGPKPPQVCRFAGSFTAEIFTPNAASRE